LNLKITPKVGGTKGGKIENFDFELGMCRYSYPQLEEQGCFMGRIRKGKERAIAG